MLITKDFLGQVSLAKTINNYPGFLNISGGKLMQKFEEHLEQSGIDIQRNEKVLLLKKSGNVFEIITDKQRKFKAKTVIIATGRDPRPLEVPGEKEFIGKGVYYSNVNNASVFAKKNVVVVGGGDSGLETSLDLAKYAKRVFLLEKTKKIIADETLQESVRETSKIKIILQAKIVSIEGPGKARAVIYKTLSDHHLWQVPVDGVFIQIGSIPATAFAKKVVKFNRNDEIKVNLKTCETSTPGLFAAGDVNNGEWKQIIIAAGEGARAALAAYKYLHRQKVD